MKTIGILGGVGPETTAHVYNSIIDSFKRKKMARYPSIVIYNLPFPFRIEKESVIEGKNSHKMIPYLIEGAKVLERSGADFGILPCNTLHKYIEKIRKAVKIPFLSILDETARNLKSMKIKTVGLLATETTVKDKLYDDVLLKKGINVLYPTRSEQNKINKVIFQLVNYRKNKSQERIVKNVCLSLRKKGADVILLACTDLQIITRRVNIPVPIIDTTQVLIAASIRELTA